MDLSFLPETNWVDLIVIIFLIRGCYIGLSQGFSAELFKVLGAIAVAVLTVSYYAQLGEWLASRSFLSLQVAQFISFLALMSVLLILVRIVRMLVFKLLHLELFYGLERWGGFTLGLLRGMVFASVFLFLLTLLPFQYPKQSVEEEALCGFYVKELAPKLAQFIVRFQPESEDEE